MAKFVLNKFSTNGCFYPLYYTAPQGQHSLTPIRRCKRCNKFFNKKTKKGDLVHDIIFKCPNCNVQYQK